MIDTTTKPVSTPFNWSKYERTYNNAIDIVAQCVGYHRERMKPIKAIILKPTSFDLFRAGLRVLMKKELDPATELYFDGVLIKKGDGMQFDTLKCEYYETLSAGNLKVVTDN